VVGGLSSTATAAYFGCEPHQVWRAFAERRTEFSVAELESLQR